MPALKLGGRAFLILIYALEVGVLAPLHAHRHARGGEGGGPRAVASAGDADGPREGLPSRPGEPDRKCPACELGTGAAGLGCAPAIAADLAVIGRAPMPSALVRFSASLGLPVPRGPPHPSLS